MGISLDKIELYIGTDLAKHQVCDWTTLPANNFDLGTVLKVILLPDKE